MPSVFLWILGSTLGMSLISIVGLIFFAVREDLLRRFLPGLVAFAAGSLLGGAFLHLLPETMLHGSTSGTPHLGVFLWFLAGFTLFLLLEQFLNWHHSHVPDTPDHQPLGHLILLADGLHNFVGGLAIGGSFLAGTSTGVITWLAAAAHEIPQEFGDFGILIHAGWKKKNALLANFISALSIVPGGLLAYALSDRMDALFLLPFAAGNFTYIAASDLIPEIKHSTSLQESLVHALFFLAGMGLILLTRLFTHFS